MSRCQCCCHAKKEPHVNPDTQRTPLHLYKSMLPIGDRTIVLLGKTVVAFPAAEVEAL
jgi:hypothetical protein